MKVQLAAPRKAKATGVARMFVALTAAVGISLSTGSPASAHGAVGSWSDNDQLCKVSSCVNTGNLVRLWQSILWVEGLYSDIDGVFGSNTHNATINWQNRYNSQYDPNISADGWVGRQSWTAAQHPDKLYHWYDAGSYEYYSFMGPNRAFNMRKLKSTGAWYFQNPLDPNNQDESTANDRWLDTSHGS